MPGRVLLLALGAIALISLPGRCLARVAPRAAPPPPSPQLQFPGGAFENRELSVRCERPPDEPVVCAISLSVDAVAPAEGSGGLLEVRDPGVSQVAIDGIRSTSAEIAPGQRAHVQMSLRRAFSHHTPPGGYFLAADALWLRHVFFASRSRRLSPGVTRLRGTRLPLFPPSAGAVRGPLRVHVQAPDDVSVRVDGEVIEGRVVVAGGRRLTIAPVAEDDEQLLRNGGPYLAAGASGDVPEDRFVLRGGYELGLQDWVIVSAAIESDFTTRATASALVELVSPAFFIFVLGLPGVSAGVGAAMEVSDQGVRGGLRLSAGSQLPVAGLQGTFDYYPDDDAWVIGIAGRVSL